MFGSIEQRGKNSFRLEVSDGYEDKKQIKYRKTVKCENKTEAKKLLKIFINELEEKKELFGKIDLKVWTLEEFFEFWENNFALEHHAPKTIINNRYLFQRIKIALGHKKIDEITPQNILAFYKNLQEPIKICRGDKKAYLSRNTIKKYHVLLHSLFQKAIKWKKLKSNPCDYVDAPKENKIQKNIYDIKITGEFLIDLNDAPIKYQCMVLILITTGIRRGELFGLEWGLLDFKKCEMKIEQQNQYIPKEGIFTKKLKTEQSYRLVSIPERVVFLLRIYKYERDKYMKEANIWHGSKKIFTTNTGEDAHPDSINSWLKKFTKKHNLPHLTPKDFRHMAATYLITAGTDLRTVAGKLGHSNSTTTQKVYSHLLKSAEKETSNTIENVLNQAKKVYITSNS